MKEQAEQLKDIIEKFLVDLSQLIDSASEDQYNKVEGAGRIKTLEQNNEVPTEAAPVSSQKSNLKYLKNPQSEFVDRIRYALDKRRPM